MKKAGVFTIGALVGAACVVAVQYADAKFGISEKIAEKAKEVHEKLQKKINQPISDSTQDDGFEEVK